MQKVRSELGFDKLSLIPVTNDLDQPFFFQEPASGETATASHEKLTYQQNNEIIDIKRVANKASRYMQTVLQEVQYSDPVARVGCRYFYRVISGQSLSDFVLARLPQGAKNLGDQRWVGQQYAIQISSKDVNANYTVSLSANVGSTPAYLGDSKGPVLDLDYYRDNLRNTRDLFSFVIEGHTLAERELPRLLSEVF